MLKKIILTIICILLPVAGFAALFSSINEISSSDDLVAIIWSILGFILLVIPGWFMWKGTKLLPIISIFPIRIVSLILGVIIFPLGIFFSLWGIWIKS